MALNAVYGAENSLIYAQGEIDVVRERKKEATDDTGVEVRVGAGKG